MEKGDLVTKRAKLMEDAVRRGKYSKLFDFLKRQEAAEIAMTFSEIEGVLGFKLPDSAHLYRPWWANQGKSGHSQSMAWGCAGWKTALVDLDGESLKFVRDREG